MRNAYAHLDAPIEHTLHGAARLHIHLGRMDGENISTRGWTFNELVSGIVGLTHHKDAAASQYRAIATLFDTLDAMLEIGGRAVAHLHEISARQEGTANDQ